MWVDNIKKKEIKGDSVHVTGEEEEGDHCAKEQHAYFRPRLLILQADIRVDIQQPGRQKGVGGGNETQE